MNKEIKFYVAIFLRRVHYFLAVFGVVAVASFSLARLLPPSYDATAKLLVESAQIPGSLAESTVDTTGIEQLQIIEQRLMTRANLLDIARKFNVFDDSGTLTADAIVEAMRRSTSIRRTGGREQATLMTISFSSNKSVVTAGVVNEYVTLLLRDNLEMRAERATDTLQFFEQEVQRLDSELAGQSQKIIAFKNANSDALPETLSYRLSQQTLVQERIASFTREISGLREQKKRLNEMFEATGRVSAPIMDTLTPEQQQLAALQNELNRALVIYSPENPRIKILQAQVSQLESQIGALPTVGSQTTTPQTLLDLQQVEIDTRIEQLEIQQSTAEAELKRLSETIDRTPENSIVLDGLNRDYANIQMQYNSAVGRLATAATGERIELLAKGQRIAVLEAATVPSKPTSPNRAMIAAGGTALGAALGGALVFLLEFMNRAIHRPRDITRHLGITPIATVPYIRTPMELVVRRAVFVAMFAVIVVGLPAALFAVHTYYLPLDLILDQVMTRLERLL
ncbi:MAG: lipopolysaccharide biosynthesis [Paracoccaceae bacterium]